MFKWCLYNLRPVRIQLKIVPAVDVGWEGVEAVEGYQVLSRCKRFGDQIFYTQTSSEFRLVY